MKVSAASAQAERLAGGALRQGVSGRQRRQHRFFQHGMNRDARSGADRRADERRVEPLRAQAVDQFAGAAFLQG